MHRRWRSIINFLLTDEYWNIFNCNIFISTLGIHRLIFSIKLWIYRRKSKFRQRFLHWVVDKFERSICIFCIHFYLFVKCHHLIQSFLRYSIVGESEFIYIHGILIFFLLFDVQLCPSWNRLLLDFLRVLLWWTESRGVFQTLLIASRHRNIF